MAAKVRAATFDQLKGKLEADIEALKARLPTKETEAAAAAQDQFYLQDRQQSLGQECSSEQFERVEDCYKPVALCLICFFHT